MILMSHDFKEVHKVVVARRKQDGRVSLDGKTADSYSAVSDSISLPGSTFEESE
jgi:hypothetical protein